MSDDLVKRLRAGSESLNMPPSVQSIKNIRCMDAMDEAAAALVAKDAEIARLKAQASALSSDADAARRASANNYERATAQSRLVADRETDCTKLMAALHHETGVREDAEAEIARLREALRLFVAYEDAVDDDLVQRMLAYNDAITAARAALNTQHKGETP